MFLLVQWYLSWLKSINFTQVEREGRLIAEQKSKKGGWFSGWFSSDKTQTDATAGSGNDIGKEK